MTGAQNLVAVAIADFWGAHHYGPSVRDLMAWCAFKSTNAIAEHLRNMERDGWVTREPRVARSIRLTAAGRRGLVQ